MWTFQGIQKTTEEQGASVLTRSKWMETTQWIASANVKTELGIS
jgi:hypothetical protein